MAKTLIDEVEIVAWSCRRLQTEAARNPPKDVTIDGILGMIASQLEDIVRKHKGENKASGH